MNLQIMALAVLSMTAIFAQDEIKCVRVSYEGTLLSPAYELGEEITIKESTSGKITIEGQLETLTTKFDYTGGEFDGYQAYRKLPFSGTTDAGYLSIGFGVSEGIVKYTESISCRGGYNGGCGPSGSALYKCN